LGAVAPNTGDADGDDDVDDEVAAGDEAESIDFRGGRVRGDGRGEFAVNMSLKV